jgi:hypothetical protein
VPPKRTARRSSRDRKSPLLALSAVNAAVPWLRFAPATDPPPVAALPLAPVTPATLPSSSLSPSLEHSALAIAASHRR